MIAIIKALVVVAAFFCSFGMAGQMMDALIARTAESNFDYAWARIMGLAYAIGTVGLLGIAWAI